MTTCYVQLTGGLGNQLFEIAAGYAHCRRTGRTLQLSRRTNCKRGVYWDSFTHRCAAFQADPPATPARLWREPHFHWAAIPPQATALSGYFQSSRYFNDVSGEIRELFTPSTAIQAAVADRYSELITEESRACSVVLHVRRTDYLAGANAAFHAVTTPEYYVRAMVEMRRRLPGARFLVFSDDLAWCRAQRFFPADTVFIDEPDECRALWLMAQFRNYIIANSSFSWWATWLAEPARLVFAPDRWFGPTGPQDWQDIYEPDWVRLPTTSTETTPIPIQIVTPLYNGIEFLEETVRSVVAQTYTNWRMTIGINGHGETGGAIAEEARRIAALHGRGQISVVVQPPPVNNKSKSLNDLIARLPSETKWVCLLDADDTWLPEKLARQVEIARSGVAADVIGTWCEYFGEAHGRPRLPGGLLPRGATMAFNPIINSSSMFRPADAHWKEEAEIQGVEDYDMWLRLDHAGRRLFNIPEVLTNHRIHRASAFNSKHQDPAALVLKYRALKW